MGYVPTPPPPNIDFVYIYPITFTELHDAGAGRIREIEDALRLLAEQYTYPEEIRANPKTIFDLNNTIFNSIPFATISTISLNPGSVLYGYRSVWDGKILAMIASTDVPDGQIQFAWHGSSALRDLFHHNNAQILMAETTGGRDESSSQPVRIGGRRKIILESA
jgi:hypothetical protein